MERKNFNVTLDLLVDESAVYADTKLQIYWDAYEMACEAEKKARAKEKRLEKAMYEATIGELEKAERKWKAAMKKAHIAGELRLITLTTYCQAARQIREESKVGEN